MTVGCFLVIRTDGDAYWAACTCGWTGPRHGEEIDARRDTANHDGSERRAS